MPLQTTLTDSGGKHCFRTFDHWPSAATKRSNSCTSPRLNSTLTVSSSFETTFLTVVLNKYSMFGWSFVALWTIAAKSPRRISNSDVKLAEVPSLTGRVAKGRPFGLMNCVPFSVVFHRRNWSMSPICFMTVMALPCTSTFCPWGRRAWHFSTMVIRAPAFAKNQASVGPAMPAPLMRTRMASFDAIESVGNGLGF